MSRYTSKIAPSSFEIRLLIRCFTTFICSIPLSTAAAEPLHLALRIFSFFLLDGADFHARFENDRRGRGQNLETRRDHSVARASVGVPRWSFSRRLPS